MIALDTETTGLDFWKGTRPYFITTCDEAGEIKFWCWDVNPLTREVDIPAEDIRDIQTIIDIAAGWGVSLADGHDLECHKLVGHNLKFDVHALRHIGVHRWPWSMTNDTLIAGHLLESNAPHNLTDMAIRYLGVDIEPYEKALEAAVKKARTWCQHHLKEWAIASNERDDMPSSRKKKGKWKADGWLPKALRDMEGHGPPEWDTVLEDYANADSAICIPLWNAVKSEMKEKGLWEMYQARMRIPYPIWKMEDRGIAVNRLECKSLRDEYTKLSSACSVEMMEIAKSYRLECPRCEGIVKNCPLCTKGTIPYDLQLPKSGNNGSLTTFVFDVMKLPVVALTDTGNPSLSSDEAIPEWLLTLPEESKEHRFVKALEAKRKRDTSISYLDSYERFWTPVGEGDVWYVIHPSLNQTGTDTLRMSSQNPNGQNVSKKPDDRGFSLRKVFGPLPGREWWAVDFQNIELRIPAFESGEQVLIDVFLRPNDPPYYGSYHLAIFDVLHPKLFKEHGKECKDLFESTWYQWCKNGSFAILYGCQEAKADQTYHVPGAYRMIKHRFPKMAALADRMVALANRQGYVETIPDKTVGPKGYPIYCSRSSWGKVSPTVPLNYHTQSTAMYCTGKAMVRCDDQLSEWKREDGFDAWIALQIHDEIVFDFPKGGRRNKPRVNRLVDLMCESGNDIGIPLTASAKYCPRNWAEHEEPK